VTPSELGPSPPPVKSGPVNYNTMHCSLSQSRLYLQCNVRLTANPEYAGPSHLWRLPCFSKIVGYRWAALSPVTSSHCRIRQRRATLHCIFKEHITIASERVRHTLDSLIVEHSLEYTYLMTFDGTDMWTKWSSCRSVAHLRNYLPSTANVTDPCPRIFSRLKFGHYQLRRRESLHREPVE